MNPMINLLPTPAGVLRFTRYLVFLAVLLTLSGCKEKVITGAEEVRWDREICVRCLMAVSDRQYSAQIRQNANTNLTTLHKFDDLGCAVIWLDEQTWKDEPGVEMWVTEKSSGNWIDARTAQYSIDNITPMAYGLGASASPVKNGLNYEQAVAHVYKIEEKFNVHGGGAHPDPIPDPIEQKQ